VVRDAGMVARSMLAEALSISAPWLGGVLPGVRGDASEERLVLPCAEAILA
jgi:hypothetical protein